MARRAGGYSFLTRASQSEARICWHLAAASTHHDYTLLQVCTTLTQHGVEDAELCDEDEEGSYEKGGQREEADDSLGGQGGVEGRDCRHNEEQGKGEAPCRLQLQGRFMNGMERGGGPRCCDTLTCSLEGGSVHTVLCDQAERHGELGRRQHHGQTHGRHEVAVVGLAHTVVEPPGTHAHGRTA